MIEAGGEHLPHGLELANSVLGAIQENGSLYSTLDSVAAITLLAALRNARVVVGPDGKIRMDGQETTLADAVSRKGIRQIEAVEGHVQVQVDRLVEEDYTAMDEGVKARAALVRNGRASGRAGSGGLGGAGDHAGERLPGRGSRPRVPAGCALVGAWRRTGETLLDWI